MYDHWTEAVRRILTSAANLAAFREQATIEPVGLLWALVHDESRGSEILEQAVITVDAFHVYFPDYPRELPEDAPKPIAAPRLMLSTASESVFDAAGRAAGEAGRHIELGSEYLLYGLLTTPSEAKQFLNERGLSASQLEAELSLHSGFETEPISVEEKLSFDGPTPGDQTDAWRMIDAAANRCSEGIRVVEDIVRFRENDPTGTRLLKEWRHEFATLVKLLPAKERLASRDTTGDVGTTISTKAEQQRASFADLLTANFKRAAEALRTIEETGKLLGPAHREIPKLAEALRYQVYTLEKTIVRTQSIPDQLANAKLYLLVTEALCNTSFKQVIEDSLANGVDIIQLREKTLDSKEFLERARWVRKQCDDAGALLMINDRPDLAVLSNADGVHLGQDDLSIAEARRILGPDKLVGRSTHNIEQARTAVLEGADYLGVGPVFPSGTKEFEDHVGLDYVQQATDEISIPWFAIGGIQETNIKEVLDAGAKGVAVCGTICGSLEPGFATSRMKQVLTT
ncbi:MAG: thiamine phosphate synthase [Planctomycetaceae bacterium]|nr:thiamine phosphate synthase [Planctomycetaceae bacterium]